ncbi:CPBP family intramembrane glutamic endopeptidase [Planomicrobium sp. CPCC 101079]|uniref:CPBP family intramembrane glutamic endopeptidase n=1 Tax=Planomicrobium sp. CPCC 101079 TaxID=2599618 RepID=UPI0021056CC9|nr:CPBP family intramembrane glutamic endopeptidase [Planomicrobium sp. CPCC 101079]
MIVILLPLLGYAGATGSPFIRYWQKPKWRETLYFPFIWSGFHRTSVKTFLIIALAVNIMAFVPFLIFNGGVLVREVWLLALIFSATNAVLEEAVWRGALLSRFSELLGDKWAVAITSLGFGLQHFSLGFPWMACLAFSIGGMFFAGVTVKSKSIFPAVMWHFVCNLLMVSSGLIL